MDDKKGKPEDEGPDKDAPKRKRLVPRPLSRSAKLPTPTGSKGPPGAKPRKPLGKPAGKPPFKPSTKPLGLKLGKKDADDEGVKKTPFTKPLAAKPGDDEKADELEELVPDDDDAGDSVDLPLVGTKPGAGNPAKAAAAEPDDDEAEEEPEDKAASGGVFTAPVLDIGEGLAGGEAKDGDSEEAADSKPASPAEPSDDAADEKKAEDGEKKDDLADLAPDSEAPASAPPPPAKPSDSGAGDDAPAPLGGLLDEELDGAEIKAEAPIAEPEDEPPPSQAVDLSDDVELPMGQGGSKKIYLYAGIACVAIILLAILITSLGGGDETKPAASTEPAEPSPPPATTTSATAETATEDAGAEDAAAEQPDAAASASATAAPKPVYRPQWRPPREDIYE